MPSPHDALRSFPIRDCAEPPSAFSLDIRRAHKRVRAKSSEQGLLMFRYNQQLFYCTVCPFGARFSQHWWGRIGSFLVRLFHRFLYLKHCLYLLVLTSPQSIVALQATYLVLLCQLFRIHVRWKKCNLSPRQTWIGWSFDFHAGFVSLHPDKRSKLLHLIAQMLPHLRLKLLEKFLGLGMWCTSLYPTIRVHLHWLYSDLVSAPDTQFSCDPGPWQQLLACLSPTPAFLQQPASTAIPPSALWFLLD